MFERSGSTCSLGSGVWSWRWFRGWSGGREIAPGAGGLPREPFDDALALLHQLRVLAPRRVLDDALEGGDDEPRKLALLLVLLVEPGSHYSATKSHSLYHLKQQLTSNALKEKLRGELVLMDLATDMRTAQHMNEWNSIEYLSNCLSRKKITA